MQMSPGEQYAQAGQMEQGQPAGQEAAGSEENPILSAFRTIMVYVAALQEKGDPRAMQLQQILSQFMDVLNAGEAGGVPQGAPQPGAQQPAPMGGAQAPGGGRGVSPMSGGNTGARPANRGAVAVI